MEAREKGEWRNSWGLMAFLIAACVVLTAVARGSSVAPATPGQRSINANHRGQDDATGTVEQTVEKRHGGGLKGFDDPWLYGNASHHLVGAHEMISFTSASEQEGTVSGHSLPSVSAPQPYPMCTALPTILH